MDSWHNYQQEVLNLLIQQEFSALYEKYQDDVIYAVVLVLDDDALSSYMAISTKVSIENMHKGIEWQGYSWVLGFFDDNDDAGVRSFTTIMMEHYNEDILPLLPEGYDFDPERGRNINLYVSAMKKAKQQLCVSLGSNVNNIVFYITIPGEPGIDHASALEINEPLDNLSWFIKTYKYFL
ncbi:hypothetical protein [Cronobacter sakazakii]|uniref:hypothetical protein n=1 Tax=Cronobacter sakazakii TaxID=28141 RepID=UPI0013B6218D|nr:hypothetical protein [Cronobacter sakazakii]ELY2861683.1 DUF4303 domain-containing protein [Cronobacter sakazakii]KAB1482718.1 DUF4303 domain-containing protein [Cronobacter sakazakii]MDT3546544.1 hypothetical protein [Cronobacter sakazakii]